MSDPGDYLVQASNVSADTTPKLEAGPYGRSNDARNIQIMVVVGLVLAVLVGIFGTY